MIANHSHGFNVITQKLSTWDPFSHNTTSWFDAEWMYGIKDGFDVVIGNPPYVQLQKNGGELANQYKDHGYLTYIRTGDIYTLFYERGLQLTKSDGLLCFITSNKWLRASYGKLLRKYFISNTQPIVIIDFGGFNVFVSATVDTAIVMLRRGRMDFPFDAVNCSSKNYLSGTLLSAYVKANKISLSKDDLDTTGEKSWVIGGKANHNLKKKIESIGVQLRNWNIKINYGIKTGCNEAFIIDSSTRDQLISEDPRSSEIIRPILRGRDIKRYQTNFAGQYIFATGFDTDIPGKYPAIYQYMKRVGEQIKNSSANRKGKGLFDRDDQGRNWWNLRACDYYDEFDKEKISWGNLALSSQFALVEAGYYISAPAPFFISSNAYYMLGVLNSRVADYYIRLLGVTRNGGYFEYKPMFVDKLPIPKICDENRKLVLAIESYVKQTLKIRKSNPDADTHEIEYSIDELIYELYELTPEEIKIIEES